MTVRIKIAFRVDASSEIGSGHVMRCLALAGALRQRQADVHFICTVMPGHLCDLIESSGYAVHRLSFNNDLLRRSSHIDQIRELWNKDSQHTAGILKDIGRVNWLITDHYSLDSDWEKAVSIHADQTMVIDDLADRQHDCDLMLNQNFYDGINGLYDVLVPSRCRLLLGPSYALLRPEFMHARNTLHKRQSCVKRILLFFGGADATHETEKTLRTISSMNLLDVGLDVVVGASNPRAEEIKVLCSSMPNVTYHRQVNTMGALLSEADLAIGAGGSTTWERCCLGVPSLVITVAENQELIARMMAENGYLVYLGKSEAVTAVHISTALLFAVHNPYLLRNMSRSSMLLVDGRGTDRVSNTLLSPDILIRPATIDDCEKIFAWRNDHETRKYFFDPSPLSFEKHIEWCRATVASTDRILLIGHVEQEDIGVVRFDIRNDQADVSVYLSPAKRCQRYGPKLIYSASRWLFEAKPGVDLIEAEIIDKNPASLKAFSEAGYLSYTRKLRLSRNRR